ncbi:MAG: flagellin [Phycisphaerae bacterium]
MLNTYNHIAALTRLSLNHAFRSLNNTTNKLLSQAGIVRADTNPAPAVLYDLAEADLNALTSGITEANDTISMNQTADAALETIHEKLQQMRALAEEVEYGDLTAEEIQTNADEYESLAAEVQTLLDETTYDDRTLLSGREPVVMFNLESVLEMDLTDMPSGGTFDVSRAMLDVTAAREQLELDNNALAQTITDMESQQDEVLSFASQLATAQQALNTLKATLDQMYSETLGATATQMNITSSDAMRLLS